MCAFCDYYIAHIYNIQRKSQKGSSTKPITVIAKRRKVRREAEMRSRRGIYKKFIYKFESFVLTKLLCAPQTPLKLRFN